MTLLAASKLSVQNVRYGDILRIPAASGYNFVTPGATEGLGILRTNPTHSTNPGLVQMTEGPAGEWTVPGGYDSLLFIDGNPDFYTLAGDAVLEINANNFPVEDEFYLIAVTGVTFPGPALVRAVDFILVFVEKASLDIFDSTTAAVDETTLAIALGLAGHNVKQRKSSYISGQLANFEVALFNPANTLSLLEADLDDDFGLTRIIEAEHITDNLGDVKTSTTQQSYP